MTAKGLRSSVCERGFAVYITMESLIKAVAVSSTAAHAGVCSGRKWEGNNNADHRRMSTTYIHHLNKSIKSNRT